MEEHGGDIYGKEIELDYSICLSPRGMPESALSAALRGVRASESYPDTKCRELTRAIAAHDGVPEEMILPGNGAAELIYALMRVLGPAETVTFQPGFSEYARAARASGSPVRAFRLSAEREFAFPSAEEICGQLQKGDLLCVCNPNNPTGSLMRRREIEKLAARGLRHGNALLIDESFLPFYFSEDEYSARRLAAAYPNLVILRSMTKIYAMPGLRLGYLLSGDRELLDSVREQLQPWNVSIPAQAAGKAAVSDDSCLKLARETAREEMAFLAGGMRKDHLADRIFPSPPFIWFHAGEDLQARLLEKRVLIRSFGDGWFRIGIRNHADNVRLLEKWRAVRAAAEPFRQERTGPGI